MMKRIEVNLFFCFNLKKVCILKYLCVLGLALIGGFKFRNQDIRGCNITMEMIVEEILENLRRTPLNVRIPRLHEAIEAGFTRYVN